MDPSTISPAQEQQGDDEWDNDEFVIPSLEISDSGGSKADTPDEETSKPSSPHPQKRRKHLLRTACSPSFTPPSQTKQLDQNLSGRKQRFKQKLKEADRKNNGTGRENKVDSLRELVGSGNASTNASKGSKREWLDPHCDEAQFEKRYSQ